MLIRNLQLMSFCAALFLPITVQAQGELSQCRSADKEVMYPCRIPGAVIRSRRDHLLQERALRRTGHPLDQSVLEQINRRSVTRQEVLRLLLDK